MIWFNFLMFGDIVMYMRNYVEVKLVNKMYKCKID